MWQYTKNNQIVQWYIEYFYISKELKNGNFIKIISNLWREDIFICLKVKLEVTKQKVHCAYIRVKLYETVYLEQFLTYRDYFCMA